MVKRLIWNDDRFRGSYRFKRPKLTLEEANERMHRYFPNIDILEYSSTESYAKVYCYDCKTEFWTKEIVAGYMYGNRIFCENCKEIKRVSTAKNTLSAINLEYLGYKGSLDHKGAVIRRIKYRCIKCGYTDDITEANLLFGTLNQCKGCRDSRMLIKYKNVLEENNCTFISKDRNDEHVLDVTFKYNACGHKNTIRSCNAYLGNIPKCPVCNDVARKLKMGSIHKQKGFVYIKNISCSESECVHLFCGKCIKKNCYQLAKERIDNSLTCKHCKHKLYKGKPKEHNKHLVNEYEKILKYTLDLKNEIENQGINLEQFKDNINYNFIKDIYEYIEGWYNNFIAIKEKYPNGDLGTVLENNPYYIHVWNIVVPVFEELLNIN